MQNSIMHGVKKKKINNFRNCTYFLLGIRLYINAQTIHTHYVINNLYNVRYHSVTMIFSSNENKLYCAV